MRTTGRVIGVASALISGGLLWRPPADAVATLLHPLYFLQVVMAALGLWATFHRESHDYLPFIAGVSFLAGFGWYFILTPFPVRWIGIGNLGYLVAWLLLRRPSRATQGHGLV